MKSDIQCICNSVTLFERVIFTDNWLKAKNNIYIYTCQGDSFPGQIRKSCLCLCSANFYIPLKFESITTLKFEKWLFIQMYIVVSLKEISLIIDYVMFVIYILDYFILFIRHLNSGDLQ